MLHAVHQIAAAASRADAKTARRAFHRTFKLPYPKASDRLDRDWARMLTCYDSPEERWRHLRTTNVVESPFAAVRLRPSAAKRYKKVEHSTAIIWRVLCVADQCFRKLNAPHRCAEVFRGVQHQDGKPIRVSSPATEKAAA